MQLDVDRLHLELIRKHMRFLVRRIVRHDRDMARQIQRATNSIGANKDEGLRARGGNRPARLSLSIDSAREVSRHLEQAWAWGYLEREDIAEPLEWLDRIRAMLWKLRH